MNRWFWIKNNSKFEQKGETKTQSNPAYLRLQTKKLLLELKILVQNYLVLDVQRSLELNPLLIYLMKMNKIAAISLLLIKFHLFTNSTEKTEHLTDPEASIDKTINSHKTKDHYFLLRPQVILSPLN